MVDRGGGAFDHADGKDLLQRFCTVVGGSGDELGAAAVLVEREGVVRDRKVGVEGKFSSAKPSSERNQCGSSPTKQDIVLHEVYGPIIAEGGAKRGADGADRLSIEQPTLMARGIGASHQSRGAQGAVVESLHHWGGWERYSHAPQSNERRRMR